MQLLLAPERADLCTSIAENNFLAKVHEPNFCRSTRALFLAEYLCPNFGGVLEPYSCRSTGALFLAEYWSPIFAGVLEPYFCQSTVPYNCARVRSLKIAEYALQVRGTPQRRVSPQGVAQGRSPSFSF